jgi:hypothetical protein
LTVWGQGTPKLVRRCQGAAKLTVAIGSSWPMPGAPAGEFIATLLTFKTTF